MKECQDFAVLADKSCTQIFSTIARNVVNTICYLYYGCMYLIADLAEERLVRDPRWCGSRQGPQPELQQEEKYFNKKSKNIYTTSWRLISLDTQHSSSRSGRIICSAKGQKRYQNWCPIIFGCYAMLCWLTAHRWRTLHSDGTVMAFLKQLWKTKRLILCKKINIILSQTPAFHEFFTNMK